jgi:hypothetical protein
MKLPKPVFTERQVGTAWAFNIRLGDTPCYTPVVYHSLFNNNFNVLLG